MVQTFQAFVVDQPAGHFTANIKKLTLGALPQSEVLIKVLYSSVNYKDALAAIPDGKIVSAYPFIPGIDLAGMVVASEDQRYRAGDAVVATGFDIGVSHFGGFSEYASIPADWLVPLPEGLTLKEAMIFGTAGFTAALSIQRLEENGLSADKGDVLVTGATGGVGSLAVSMLAELGYSVVASTGKQTERDYLQRLGAAQVITREAIYDGTIKPLDGQRWAAAVDPVGGAALASLLSQIKYHGSVAVCGLTGGSKIPTTVYPFILRGVNLLGIDSVYCPMAERKKIWKRMATDWKPRQALDLIQKEISLNELPDVLPLILNGRVRGRMVVRLSPEV
ncbi:acryloyl-CoA reductase [Sporolactobacillus sp. THM7-7]|nr:acryloyl-CoA reductase [Sporolactobacillus sp. THM7-7]